MSVKTWCEDHGAQLFIVSLMILLVVLMLPACGVESKSKDPEPPTKPPVADKAWDELKPLVQENCGSCHNGTVHPLKFDTGAKFKASKSRAKLEARLMPPPPRTISEDAKQKMLQYLR